MTRGFQHVDLVSADDVTRGVEFVGWDPESQTLRSHDFAGSGELSEYTYDITGDTLTIWFGGTDSPAKFVGPSTPPETATPAARSGREEGRSRP